MGRAPAPANREHPNRQSDMRELSLHILDIAENAATGGATHVSIRVEESAAADRLTFAVEDNGRGLPESKAHHLDDPFITSRTTRRVGLGLSLLAAAARRCEGTLEVGPPATGSGTRVTASFRRSHIDRAPLGDVAATLATLIAAFPAIDFDYTHGIDGNVFSFNTRDLREELAGMPLTDPAVMLQVTESLRRALQELAAQAASGHKER
jgi:hypothetical protein